LLANIVKCGRCGASFQLQTSGKDVKYRYYNCRSVLRIGKEACSGFPVAEGVLNRAVLEHVAEKIFSEERCSKLVKELVDESGVLRQKTHEHRRQLQLELKDIERRVQRWEEAFESGTMAEEVGADRLQALKAKRAELKTTLSKVVPIRPPPEAIRTGAAIRRFQSNLKELFLGGDNGVARNYLRLLIERIVVHGPEVEIHVRGAEAIALMASPEISKETKKETTEAVRASVGGWLPSCAGSKNFTATVVIDLETARKRLRPQAAPLARESTSERAQRWLGELESGEVESRAAIARREGISRARVTQVMSNAPSPPCGSGIGSK
jgi:hypothetical protein